MPPFVIPPLVKLTLAVLGAGAVVHWVVKEARRINQELERVKTASAIDRQSLPKLRRDPDTGEFRPM
ncbi:MAG TPA: hypothetical protein VH397_04340 [Xanthobacteraceae bacterium]|jgi:hypothetical protein